MSTWIIKFDNGDTRVAKTGSIIAALESIEDRSLARVATVYTERHGRQRYLEWEQFTEKLDALLSEQFGDVLNEPYLEKIQEAVIALGVQVLKS